jgi:hypothetical protein
MDAASPTFAIYSYKATPATERTEVGALMARWDDDANPATPDRLDGVRSGAMADGDAFPTAKRTRPSGERVQCERLSGPAQPAPQIRHINEEQLLV